MKSFEQPLAFQHVENAHLTAFLALNEGFGNTRNNTALLVEIDLKLLC